MKIIVVDFEATCTDKDEFPRNESEIIEFGAVCIDSETGLIDDNTFSGFIKPVLHPVLTDFCKQLTTIKQIDVDRGETFKYVAHSFIDWCQNHGAEKIYSWGDFDKNIFRRDCIRNKLDPDYFVDMHVNAKQKFADLYNIKPCGVSKALTYKSMKFDGTAHRALDDAQNIAKIILTSELW